MASNKLIVLAPVMIAFVGLVSAAAPAPATGAAAGPSGDDTIGTDDGGAASAPATGGDSEVAAGPLGSSAANNAGGGGSAEAPASGASALEVSAIAGLAIVAGGLF